MGGDAPLKMVQTRPRLDDYGPRKNSADVVSAVHKSAQVRRPENILGTNVLIGYEGRIGRFEDE